MSSKSTSTTYNCDTLPAPQHLFIDIRRESRTVAPAINGLTITDSHDSSGAFDVPTQEEILNATPVPNNSVPMPDIHSTAQPRWANQSSQDGDREDASQSRERKLCVRHLRMADEGTYSRLQQSLDALPLSDRQTVNAIWSTFSSSSHARRATILQGLLTMCCFTQLSFLTEQLNILIRLDPLSIFPREVSLKILGFLDAKSLSRSAQVCKSWSQLANDDILWRHMCEQHIGHTCKKCGWGLPRMKKRRNIPLIQPGFSSLHVTARPGSGDLRSSASPKRELVSEASERPSKRSRSASGPVLTDVGAELATCRSPGESLEDRLSSMTTITRPWKNVYMERLAIEKNWRLGRAEVRTFKGHTDGIMCMQFSENLEHPSYPVLITGSYDRSVRVWNLDTGETITVMHGHGRAVRALQFDSTKLITASMDRTLKVWNWRTGTCIRTLEGHTEGVVCLHFDSNVLASGGVDTTIKIWNFRTGECFTLRGHDDWVNSLQLWDPLGDRPHDIRNGPQPNMDPGKMLFSASDDGTIRLWDLTERAVVRTFVGHCGQVQSIKILHLDSEVSPTERESSPERSRSPHRDDNLSLPGSTSLSKHLWHHPSQDDMVSNKSYLDKSVLVSGSLDGTIRIWDPDTGKNTSTLFGHVEGIWSVSCSPLRVVSTSHDRTIKVWSLEDGSCVATHFGHRSPVTCLWMGDDKFVSGSDDGEIRVWEFSEKKRKPADKEQKPTDNLIPTT